jgi:hypothetical protein
MPQDRAQAARDVVGGARATPETMLEAGGPRARREQ